MRSEAPPVLCKLLVIGYGNTLRSDDGAGVRVAEAIGALGPPGVTALAPHQLTPEIVEHLAGAREAVFVDARIAEVGQGITIGPLEPASSIRPASHTSDPRSLLALARSLHGRAPAARLITVPAVDRSLGETLSATAARGVEAACARILAMLDGD
jgi:hydrogenase maturation protease